MEKKVLVAPIGMEVKKSEKENALYPLIKKYSQFRIGTFKRVLNMGSDFPMMKESRQVAIVKNCVIHSAKYLDRKLKKASKEAQAQGYEKSFVNSGKESFVAFINGQDKDDIMQQAFLNALEMATEESATETPLLLMVCKATTKAINSYFYKSKKARANSYDIDFNTPCFDNVEYKVIDTITRADIYDLLPHSKKMDIVTMLDMKEYGYTVKEIAVKMCITVKTLAEYERAYKLALAKYYALNGFAESAREIINTLKGISTESKRKQVEKEIACILKGTWKAESARKDKVLSNWLSLSYIERINAFTNNKELYNKVCAIAFNK